MMYDIVLTRGCKITPELRELFARLPMNTDIAKLENILAQPIRPGFLGLHLPTLLAQDLLYCLLMSGAHGYRIPSAYQCPQITQEVAYTLAEQALSTMQAEGNHKGAFVPLQSSGDDFAYWQFESGVSHNSLFICVDKLDGHIWQDDEHSYFVEEAFVLERALATAHLQTLHSSILRWPSQYVNFDLYTFSGRANSPFLDDLSKQLHIPLEELQEKITRRGGGFRNLDLSYEIAGTLLRRLIEDGVKQGCRVPSAYRQPKLSIEEARMIADKEVQKQLVHFPGFKLKTPCSLESFWEGPCYWTFSAPYQLIVDEDDPTKRRAKYDVFQEGGSRATAYIDKLDGHNWTAEEMYSLREEGTMLSCLHTHPDLERFFS